MCAQSCPFFNSPAFLRWTSGAGHGGTNGLARDHNLHAAVLLAATGCVLPNPRALLERIGFEILATWSDYSGAPFDARDSNDLLLLSRRPG